MKRALATTVFAVLFGAWTLSACAADPGQAPGKFAARAAAACAQSQNPSEDGEMRSARLSICLTFELAFTTDLYFHEDVADDPGEPGGLVDAVDAGALHGPRWAFAIDLACPGSIGFPPPCRFEQERLLIRVVSPKPASVIPPSLHGPAAPTLEAERAYLDQVLDWRVADLRACPGAIRALLALEKVQWFAFNDDDRSIITKGKPGGLIVAADGESIVVRARGFVSTFTANEFKDSGAISGWAENMRRVVEPCLKPESAPAPWDRD